MSEEREPPESRRILLPVERLPSWSVFASPKSCLARIANPDNPALRQARGEPTALFYDSLYALSYVAGETPALPALAR